MIDGTFACVPRVGPARERELWRRGIRCWRDFPEAGSVLSPKLDGIIRERLGALKALLAAGKFEAIAEVLPSREWWRFIPAIEREACYLDIETGFDGRVTVIGCYDERRGPRLYVRGWNLGAFRNEPLPAALVTFNGGSFDVPVLRRTFPGWAPPALHVDLRTVTGQLNERGGLKAIEERFGLERPPHLRGVDGSDALTLWHAFANRRDRGALERLLEYNLYDVVQLRSVAQIACERLAARSGRTWAPAAAFRRGDVRLDITRVVESVTSQAERIVPDMFHDEERISLRP